MFFVQMSGIPGSGKSTLSREIAQRTGAVVVDCDVVKSSLMLSLQGTGMNGKEIGKVSYSMNWALIEFHLSQGKSVIFDSPCLYQEMIEKGTKLAETHRAAYKYVECYLEDLDEINRRLKSRERKVSQVEKVKSEEVFTHPLHHSKKPSEIDWYRVDTSLPVDAYIEEVMSYIGNDHKAFSSSYSE